MDLKALLYSVGGSNNYTNVKQLIADLKDANSSNDAIDDDDKPGVEEDVSEENQLKWDVLESSIDQLSDYIFKFQEMQDRQVLPNLKSQIGDSIIDYTTAYNATETYTKEWFSRSFLSNEGKIDLALYLISIISKYCKSNMETLRLIANRDPNLILFISFPRSLED